MPLEWWIRIIFGYGLWKYTIFDNDSPEGEGPIGGGGGGSW